MGLFTILSGGIKKDGVVHGPGKEINLSAEEAERINKKGNFLEPTDVFNAKAKAKAESEAAIKKAEKESAEKLAEESKKAKGGGK